MKSNKRRGFLSLMLGMAVMLSACGGESGGSSATNAGAGSASESEGTGEKIQIKYWYAFGDKIEEAKQELVKRFNESQDEIEVIAEYQGNYDDLHAKVQAAFAAGDAPAVSDLEIASTATFARYGMIQELGPLAEQDAEEVQMDDFNPGLMGNAYVDDKLYGLPFMRSTPIMYMNVTVLEEAGLDPAGPKNWQEFEEYGRTLKEKGISLMTMPVDIWFYEGLVAQSGGQILTEDGKSVLFNSPEGVEPVEFWKKLASEGLIKIPVGDEAGATADKDWANQTSAFKFGSTAGVAGAIDISEGNNFEFDTAFMPANKSYGVPTGGCQLVMTSKLTEEEQAAAWEFIKFMTTTESTIYQSEHVGYLPTRLSALETEEMQSLYKEYPQYKVAVDQLEYARPRPMETAYPEVAQIMKSAIEKTILDANVTPQQALDEAAEKANALLSK